MNKKLLAEIKEHPTPSSNSSVGYIITSSIESVKDQNILFLSFFNQKKVKSRAEFKVFICGNKYISQKLQQDTWYKWSMACLENLIGYWDYSYANCKNKVDCETEDRERIAQYLGLQLDSPGDVLYELKRFQEEIMKDNLNIKHQRIKDRVDSAMSKVLELPDDFKSWVDIGPFDFSRYIYYKREGKRINAFCTGCRKEFVIMETEESKKTVKHNNKSYCPKCNKRITYKALGRTKHLSDESAFSIIQNFEDCIVVRYFYGVKEYDYHYRNPGLRFYETVREIYSFKNDHLNIKRYEKAYFCQTSEYRWCDYKGKNEIPATFLYTNNLTTVLANTNWKYSCLHDYANKVKAFDVYTFLKEYVKYPAIEYLIKLKLYNFLRDKLNTQHGPMWSDINFNGKNIKEILGIDKPLLEQMQRLNLGNEEFLLIKSAANKGKTITDEQIKWLSLNVRIDQFSDMLSYSSPSKAINYIEKQSNEEYSYRSVLSDWCDYINQCKELKFDLNNTFILYPNDLKTMHEEYTILNKAKGLEKYDKKVAKVFENLNEVYSYEDKKLFIRIAKNVNEIVQEGHRQRHCVGGLNYVKGAAEGSNIILFIRKIDSPEESFYTLELNVKILKVNQCRGYKNCDTTEDVNNFIGKWKQNKLTVKRKKAV